MKRPVFIVLILVLAVTPVWVWYIRRIFDGSDEPWGILALGTFAAFVIWRWSRNPKPSYKLNLIFPALVLLAYAISYPFVSPLIRGILAMTTLALIVSRLSFNHSCHLGLWGLAMLSLPLIASLQFYLGYPLRVLSGNLSVPMLRFTGYAVVREGPELIFGGEAISIDAPCSGIKMLWVGGYLVCVLSSYWNFNIARTLAAGLVGIAAVVIGNSVRVAALFYMEIGLLDWPKWSHLAVGMVAFAFTAVVILLVMQRLITPKEQMV